MGCHVVRARVLLFVCVCVCMRENTKAYDIFIGKSEKMRPLRIPRLRLENNIKMDHEKVTWEGVD